MDCEPLIVSLCLGVERERRTSAGTNSSDSALQASVSAVSTCVTVVPNQPRGHHQTLGCVGALDADIVEVKSSTMDISRKVSIL